MKAFNGDGQPPPFFISNHFSSVTSVTVELIRAKNFCVKF